MTVRTAALTLLAVPLLAGLGLAGPALAGDLLVPVAEERYVGASAEVTVPGDHAEDVVRDEAAPFAPFAGAETATATVTGASVTAGATQGSSIGAASIVATGTCGTNSQLNVPGSTGIASCLSRCHVTFDVPRAATYTVSGTASANNNGQVYVELREDGGPFLYSAFVTLDFDVPLSAAGYLAPGRYVLRVGTVGGGSGAHPDVPIWADGEYDLALDLAPTDPGVATCFGTGCPCGNDDAAAGCANATGAGGLLGGSGTASLATDDLVLDASGLPVGQSGLVYAGDALGQSPFFDGLQCATGTTFRFLASIDTTTASGTFEHGPGLAAEAGGLFAAGATWHFQLWHRDLAGPCGTGANLTNVYSLTWQP